MIWNWFHADWRAWTLREAIKEHILDLR